MFFKLIVFSFFCFPFLSVFLSLLSLVGTFQPKGNFLFFLLHTVASCLLGILEFLSIMYWELYSINYHEIMVLIFYILKNIKMS